MIWLVLLLALQIAPRMLSERACGIAPTARADLDSLWTEWRWQPSAPPAACLLGRANQGAVIEMVLPTADLETCRHERVIGGLKFEPPDLLSDEHLKLLSCSLLDGRLDWYVAVAMTGIEDGDFHVCARLAEGVEGDRIGTEDDAT